MVVWSTLTAHHRIQPERNMLTVSYLNIEEHNAKLTKSIIHEHYYDVAHTTHPHTECFLFLSVGQ